MQDAVAGIDLGGTSTKFGLVTSEGNLLAYNAIPTNSNITYQCFFRQLYDHIQELKANLDTGVNLLGIGIGAPSGNYRTATIENASNLHWKKDVPVKKVLETYTSLPTVLMNDADASAVGEMLFGTAKGMKDFVSITLGTGLGCGIVANGELLLGQRGHAGEIGHITVFYDGRECACGRQGCLEAYVSAPGLVTTAQDLLSQKNTNSVLSGISEEAMDAKNITSAAQQEDKIALEAFNYTGKILGWKLADIVASLNPEAIIISGGLAKAGSLILEPAKRCMEDHLLGMFKNKVEVLSSSLTEKNAAIMGASASIWKELEEERAYSL